MSHDDDALTRFVRRREALLGLGAAGAGAVLLGCGRSGASRTFETPEALAASACTLSAEATEGPYYVPGAPTRRDVREHRKGVLLALTLTVRDGAACGVIRNADVEIWHADARGTYSGVSDHADFLRGHQRTDRNGHCRFLTIFPGWYRGRTPHIHVKVHVGGDTVHTGQLFFRDAISERVYDTSAYRSRGDADTTNAEDAIFRAAGGSRALVRVVRRSRAAEGLNGSATLVVNRG